MSNPQYRFYAVEHIGTMIIAVAPFKVARAKTKRSEDEKVEGASCLHTEWCSCFLSTMGLLAL